MELKSVAEKTDKHGKMMAWATGVINGCQLRGVIFGTKYPKLVGFFDMKRHKIITIDGYKDDRGGLVINKAAKYNAPLLNKAGYAGFICYKAKSSKMENLAGYSLFRQNITYLLGKCNRQWSGVY